MMMMSSTWGTELWDKYGDLTHYTKTGLDFLEHTVASYIKERAGIEADYAKSLRSLAKKYQPKDRPRDDELTHVLAFKQMLKEVGFQANQHDVLHENFSKQQYKALQEKIKQLKDQRKKNMKEAEKIESDLKKAFKVMDAAKDKFRKAYEEQEKAVAIYNKAENDGQVSRNEVSRLRQGANQRSQVCETAKGKYASQLVKTNDAQRLYYHEQLPRVINELQGLERTRLDAMVSVLRSCVTKEREVSPIVTKCLDAMEKSLNEISPDDDAEIIIERLKSGDVPPGDFKFEDMSDPLAMLNQDVARDKPMSLNLYPKKKELERLIESAERKLDENVKTLDGCQGLLKISQERDPKYAKSKDCQALRTEIGNRQAAIATIESDLTAMRADLGMIEGKLEALRMRSSPRAVNRGGSQSSGSLKSSSLSIGSNNGTPTSTPGLAVAPANINNNMQQSESAWDEPYEAPVRQNHVQALYSSSDDGSSSPTAAPSGSRAVALYPYEGDPGQDSSISMGEGEEFEVVNEDGSGWTHVRRLATAYHGQPSEGFVPTSYLRVL